MITPLNWAILGTGMIAPALVRGIADSKAGKLLAIASRSPAKAQAFAAKHNVPRFHASDDAALADTEVHALYIALPNHLHCEWTVKAAAAGKHVLCEKPLASNLGEAMVMVEECRRSNVFLLEAFMYRCHPQILRLVELIKSGIIGEVRVINAHFAYNMGLKLDNIRLQNQTAGGAIVDVGCYTLSAARLVAGAAQGKDFADPLQLTGYGHLGALSRVDEYAVASLKFPGNIVANLTCGSQVNVESDLRVFGSKGNLRVPSPWFAAPKGNQAKIIVNIDGQPSREEPVASEHDLYAYQVDLLGQGVAAGKLQAPSPAMTWADSLGNQRVLDDWRRSVGLVFDREKPGAAALTQPFSGRPLTRRPEAKMEYLKIAGLDKPIARAVLGSMAFEPGKFAYSFAILDDYFERGGNAIDTAHINGTEAVVGQWLKHRRNRDQMIIIGKGGHTPFCTPLGIREQFNESLQRQGIDAFDLYILHRDNPDLTVEVIVDVLHGFYRAGKFKVAGGSNWSLPRLEAADRYARALGMPGFVSSNNFALARWNEPMWAGCVSVSDPDSLAWHEQTQMPLFAWSSQASGFLTGRYTPADRDNPAASEVVRVWFNDGNFQRLDRARQLAAEKSVGPADIALAYVLSQPFPTFALIGPQSIEETRSSLDHVGLRLTPAQIAWLDLRA